MTIRTHLSPADLSRHLSALEACAEDAPEGTYEDAKDLRQLLGDTCDTFMARLRGLGLDAPNCDQIREVEAVLYGYVRDANPLAFASAEGFGLTMAEGGEVRARVIAGAERDRDFLAAHRGADPSIDTVRRGMPAGGDDGELTGRAAPSPRTGLAANLSTEEN